MTTHYEIHQSLSVDVRSVAPDHLVYRDLLVYRCVLREDGDVREWEGFASEPPTPRLHRPPGGDGWRLVSKTTLDLVQEWGFMGETGDGTPWNGVSKRPYSQFDDETQTLVRVDGLGHMVFDAEDRPLPVGDLIDYIEGGLHDERYDLARAFAILEKHPHVRALQHEEIPHYNRTETQTAGLSCRWVPDAETYRRAWAQCLAIDSGYPSTKFPQAVRELDLLGLRAAER